MGDTSGLSPIMSVPNRLRFLHCAALALWLAAALLSGKAQAWGPVGHQTVAMAARAQLTPEAVSRLQELMALEPAAT